MAVEEEEDDTPEDAPDEELDAEEEDEDLDLAETGELSANWWSDAGTSFDSLLRTNILVAGQRGGLSEEISMETIRKSASALLER